MRFFTSPKALGSWVREHKTADQAALNLMEVVGKNDEQDIVQTCRSIFNKEDGNPEDVLFGVLAKYKITQMREGNMKDKLVKQAQAVMRSDSLYGNMDMRICPKLPKQSAGQGLISTYNCRTYCLDSIVFDDDPNRVYCAEALWRRHVMDKFSREFKDKDGKWVGGYINERFQIFRDDGGNNMELAHGERTRKPRPHQYSTERRLEEGRGGKTTDITASSNKIVKLASVEKGDDNDNNYRIFDDIIEMKEAGLSSEDIIYKVAEHYNKSIMAVASIHKMATKLLERHNGTVYACNNSKIVRVAQSNFPDRSTLVTKKDIEVTTINDGQKRTLKLETPVVIVSSKDGQTIMQVVDGEDTGKQFKLDNQFDLNDAFGLKEEIGGEIQEAASEVGLNDEMTADQSKDFPVVQL